MMSFIVDDQLRAVAAEHPYPLLFVTVSGAHLYGFPSQDSDYDLRGVHILPVHEVVGLHQPRETIEISEVRDGREIDLVTHDVKKFMLLLLKKIRAQLSLIHRRNGTFSRCLPAR